MITEQLIKIDDYEKSQIFSDNKNLIIAVLKNLNLLNRLDDFYDVGLIGFTKAINTYDEGKNIKLSSYICVCIEHEIFQEIRSQNAKMRGSGIRPISLNQIVTDENNQELMEIIPSDVNIEEEVCHKELINHLSIFIEKLSSKEKTVLEHYYGLNGNEKLTQQAISRVINVRQSHVSRLLNNAISKLKGMMEENDLFL